jgi:hypothetical protein
MRSSTLLSALAAATLTTASPLFNPAQLAFNPTQAAASLQQGLSHLAEGLLGSLPDDYVSKTKALADDSWGMIKGFAEENGKQCTFPRGMSGEQRVPCRPHPALTPSFALTRLRFQSRLFDTLLFPNTSSE